METHRDLLPLDDTALLRQCDVQTRRGSGPGGQKRNKTSSAVRLCHLSTGITVGCDETRSQHQNRQKALRRLRERIALTLRAEPESPDGMPDCLQRLLKGMLSRRSVDYLPAVAALLDRFVAADCSVGETAAVLGVSTGAMSRRLLSDESLAKTVNGLRSERGLRLLR